MQPRWHTASLDLHLSLAEEAWAELPEVEAVLDSWSPSRRTTFLEEWPLQDDLLERLGRRARAAEMTAAQLARWHALQRLVEANRPIIGRLLARRRGATSSRATSGEVASG